MKLSALKRTIILPFVMVTLFGVTSCVQNRRTESQDALSVNEKFQETKKLARYRTKDLFDVFNKDLTEQESDALKFLYAYMPLSDLADYTGDFYLQHVRITLKARNEIGWAKDIPDDIFRHFILPHRINNENLDSSRVVIFNELKERIEGLSMYDAALEVNHWCHEKVEYRPADIRTSSPLATMKTAYGRCGEESTFTVAALRSVCIPARQVYSPRWAHSDDNHAWVEVWIDGEWMFLGACEPEPVLNLGWFNEAASRAMLVHARVYGEYQDMEEVNVLTSQYFDTNVLERYARTFRQQIKIVDTDGHPVPNVKIEYQLYNYAEFYSLATKRSDHNGVSSLITGYGELLIWASSADQYGFRKIRIGEKDTVTVTLSNPEFEDIHWEIMPPAASDFHHIHLTEEQITENRRRLHDEDSIRNNYVSTFISREAFLDNSGDEKLWKYIKESRGNYQEIIDFIVENQDVEWIESMLHVIASKDLRDTKAAILNDHLSHSLQFADHFSPEIFVKYILNPRVANEMLLAYRGYLSDELDPLFNNDVHHVIAWVTDSITIKDDAQSYALPITPVGVHKLRVSDSKSRDIFFVAVCRTSGIAGRLEPGTGTPQYLSNNQWIDVHFDGKPEQYKKFDVRFQANNKNLTFTPQYYHHFSLARFENSRFKTLDLGEYVDIDKIEDFQLREGLYRLITSNRLSSGRILVDMQFLKISGETIIGLDFPEGKEHIEIQGHLSRRELARLINDKNERTRAWREQSNIVIAVIEAGREPSKHVLNDIQRIQKDFDKLNNTIIFLLQKRELPATFKVEDYPDLPYRTIFRTTDADPGDLLKITMDNNRKGVLPEIFIANPKGEIIYHSEGYHIGIGNDILQLL
ncbi:MAG: transglutaminase-like domain-containing protein [Bacteroidota bacterium]